ncbi:hypothetical protein GOODEAATRI_028309 [Goodea atripinnis]|uniref:Fibronectin type-III domain-containing protein n=1 Tax=Goodea atripinnis TaxID=208336 RepID=A0ABV0P0C8_9TELE
MILTVYLRQEMDSAGVLELAALGRPFTLGTLYNHCKDSIVQDSIEQNPWDYDDLTKHIQIRPHKHTDLEMITSDSLEEKSSALSLDVSLKASFLFGLIKCRGSAEYFNDSKMSKNHARVTVKYRATTQVKELSMYQLGKLRYPSVIDKGLATHVVTAILYGAQAFFVFDQEVAEHENHADVHGNMAMIVNKMSQLAGDIKGDVKMYPDIENKVNKFSCQFHGDFCLDKSPTTFQEAIETYKSLPGLLKDGEKAVPVKVFMLPLTCLNSSASKLVRQISVGLVQEAQSVLEDFSELERRCNHALKITAVQYFPDIKKKFEYFKELCCKLKHQFQQSLGEKLSLIRESRAKEAELADILKKKRLSSFNNKSLNWWMDCKEREINTIRPISEMMQNTKIIPSQNHLDDESQCAGHVVCFVFTSLGSDEPFLSALSDYLKGTKPDDLNGVEKEQWYTSKENVMYMRKKAVLLENFVKANQNNQKIKFLAVGLRDDKHKGSTIYHYEDGILVSDNFEPPSEPESVTAADINHNSVTLKVSPPRFGAENITSYSVEVCVHREDGWKQKIEPKAEEVTVRDLKPNTEYVFRCRAVTSAGVGPAHVVNDPIRTLPCRAPGEPHIEPNIFDAIVS